MDTYTSFMNNLFCYLTKNNSSASTRGAIIRKHDNVSKGDLSFPSNISCWKPYLSVDFSSKQEKILSSQDDIDQLIADSKNWSLNIDKLIIENDLILIHLNRFHCFQMVLNNVLNQNENYGKFSTNETYSIESEIDCKENIESLTQLRVKLLKDVTNRLLQFYGYSPTDPNLNKTESKIYVTSKSSNFEKERINILAGAVVNMMDGKKYQTITSEEFYSKRELDMRLLAEHKYGLRISQISTWRELFVNLGNAAVIIEMLQIKPSNTLKINFNDPNVSNNKGASFILYNCARIASIIKKFEDEKLSLPQLSEIDINLLNQPEEWELLYNYILYFPVMIKNCCQLDKKQINPHYLCSFLFGLCSKFSVYYRRVRILTSFRKEHMLPTMYARIYLLKCIQIILYNSLKILNIQPITQM